MKTPKYLLFQGVLEWCNEIRKERGINPPLEELPKGIQMDGYSCPCGKATGVFVGTVGWAKTKEAYSLVPYSNPIPMIVQEFVPRFDDGEFPELQL